MTERNLYKQIEEMVYKDANKAEKILFDASDNKLLDNVDVTDLLIKLGAELWVRDKTAKAKEILNIAFKQAEDDDCKAEALEYIARCYNDEKKFKKAFNHYEKIISLTQNPYLLGSAYQGIAGILYNLDKKKEALNYYLKSLQYFDAKDPKYSDSIEINVSKIIHLYLYFGNKENADVYIDKVIGDSKATLWILCETYYDLGHYYYRREDWHQALENYERALSYFDKKDHDILADMYSYIADCYYRQGHLDEAKEWYHKSLEFTSEEDKERLKHRKDSLKYINDVIKKSEQ